MHFLSKYIKLGGIFSKEESGDDDDSDSDGGDDPDAATGDDDKGSTGDDDKNETGGDKDDTNRDSDDEVNNNKATPSYKKTSSDKYSKDDNVYDEKNTNYKESSHDHDSIIKKTNHKFPSSVMKYSLPAVKRLNLSDRQELSLSDQQRRSLSNNNVKMNENNKKNIRKKVDLTYQKPLSNKLNFYNQNKKSDHAKVVMSNAINNTVNDMYLDNREKNKNRKKIDNVTTSRNTLSSKVRHKKIPSRANTKRKRLNNIVTKKPNKKSYWLRAQDAIKCTSDSALRRSKRLLLNHSLNREQERRQIIELNNNLLSSFVQPPSLLNHYIRELSHIPSKSKCERSLNHIKSTKKRISYATLCKREFLVNWLLTPWRHD